MRLQRVQLRNYRGVPESDVSFSQNGVTIVEGPNEAGKTAISEGIQLAIEMPDSSQHARVKAVQPVGRDEGPEVEISLSTGAYELVYHKRWLRQPRTTLEVKAPHPESLTGREAHDRLKAILAETLDDELWRGIADRARHRTDIAQFLVCHQWAGHWDRAAGGDLAADREETLWTRITEEYDRYWTPTGHVRTGRRTSEQGVQDARDRVAKLEKQLQDIESDVALISWLMDESSRLSETIGECGKREREIEQRWNAVRPSAQRGGNALMQFTVPRRRSATVPPAIGSAAKL